MTTPYGTRRILVYEVALPGPDPRAAALPDDYKHKALLLDLTYIVHQRHLRNGLNVWPLRDLFNLGFLLRVGPLVWTVRRRKAPVRLYGWPWWKGWCTVLTTVKP